MTYSFLFSATSAPTPNTSTASPPPIIYAPSKQRDSDSAGSEDTSPMGKPTILCVCLFQNFETIMLCCVVCQSYSHGNCYESLNLSTIHICAKCALKTGRPCTSARVLDRFTKSEKSNSDRKLWVFDLMKRHVMKSILNEEFKSIQPGQAPDKNFLRLRFHLSESYTTRVLFSLERRSYNPLWWL